jgi:hypothetical protein
MCGADPVRILRVGDRGDRARVLGGDQKIAVLVLTNDDE